jgi:DNA repair protein RecO (recombination protein O)
MQFKYNGIILNKFDIGETDRLYNIYTLEVGKMRAKAIGVKKPNAKLAGNLEPITQAEIFMARGRGKGNITGAIAINNFLAVKSDISALRKIFYVFGIFNRLVTDEEKDEKIFNLLLGYLKAMEFLCRDTQVERLHNENKSDIITLGFLFKLLLNLGYGIEVEKCVSCGEKLKTEDNYFSPESGGMICASCGKKLSGKIKISSNAIKLIRVFLKNKLENFKKISAPKEDIRNLKIIIEEEVKWIGN